VLLVESSQTTNSGHGERSALKKLHSRVRTLVYGNHILINSTDLNPTKPQALAIHDMQGKCIAQKTLFHAVTKSRMERYHLDRIGHIQGVGMRRRINCMRVWPAK